MNLSPSNMHLSGPIPGQSLTVDPGSVPWETPPKFTQVDDAIQFIIKQMQDPQHVHAFLATMEMGAPLDTVLGTLIQHGFAEGLWTPSLGAILMQPLAHMFVAMLKRAGIKYIPSYRPMKGQLDSLFGAVQKKSAQQKVTKEEFKKFQDQLKTSSDAADAMNAPPSGGLMSPPTQGATS